MTEQTADQGAPQGAQDAAGEGLEATQAFSVKQSFDAELEAIRGSHSLNEEGKQAAIERAYEGASQRYTESIERQESEAAESVVAAEQALFKLTSGHADYRAALERAEYAGFAESPQVQEQELTRMLDRATLVGDDKQAMAVFHIAMERGLEPVMRRYLESRPEKARLAQRLMDAREKEERVKQATGWARAYPIRKPPELNSWAARPGEARR